MSETPRVDAEINSRSDIVGIFAKAEAIVRLVGALLPERSNEQAVRHARELTLETSALTGEDAAVSPPPWQP